MYNPNLRRNKYGGYFLVDASDNHMSEKRYHTGYGERDTQSGIEFATSRELDEYRRDKNIRDNEQEAKERNKQDKPIAGNKKPRRKAMKEKYNIGDTIKIDGESYKIIGTHQSPKLNGYFVQDIDGTYWIINKFGERIKW